MIAEYKIESGNVTDERGIAGITASWAGKTEEDVLSELLNNKTTYGARVARAFATIETAERQTPEKLKTAFDIALHNSDGESEEEDGNEA